MPASKARKVLRERQLKAAEKEAQRLQEAEINNLDTNNADSDGDSETQDQNQPEIADQDPSSSTKPPKIHSTNHTKNATRKAKSKAKSKPSTADGESASTTKPRFIVFVGKLPFTATDETIRAHFSRLEPTSIRHLTDKQTGRSKGCAFVEFARYDQMKECLKAFHHSLFDDGKGGERRTINIELTVGGGGGKSRDRKEKLRAKNDRLTEERHRRAGERKENGQAPRRSKPPGMKPVASEDQSGFHPSRLARLRG